MNSINVLFVNRSQFGHGFSQERESILAHLCSLSHMTIQATDSIEKSKGKLAETDVLVMWIDRANADDWHKLDDFMEDAEELYYVGFIVIFEFHQAALAKARETLLRTIDTFVCPVNPAILEAYIETLAFKMQYKKSLEDFKQEMLSATSLESIINKAFQRLNNAPLNGYDRATISLIDRDTEARERYFLEFDDRADPNQRFIKPKRDLMKAIAKDRLIQKVDQEEVFILQNLESLRKNPGGQKLLEDWGWEDEYATKEVRSWVGLAAKRQKQTVAIFTLDSEKPDIYQKNNHELVTFLKDFGKVFADAIDNFYAIRNERVVKEIINEIGDDLRAEDLIIQILQKLKKELCCNNCNYFLVAYDSNQKRQFLEEWLSANPDPNPATPEKEKHQYYKGTGVVGAVLESGNSRIVPHASEDPDFVPTLKHPGDKLSMLVVPVAPTFDKTLQQSKRIIGVISCYKEEKTDYFTPYDRDLVKDIALSTATVIERTMTLDFSKRISSTMANLVDDPNQAEDLLKQICSHALEVTSAGAASIHLLRPSLAEQKYFPVRYPYYTYPDGVEAPPRLNGQGTTDLVIEKGETVEFSEQHGNFWRVAEEQRSLVKYKLVVPLIVAKGEQSFLIGALYLNKYSEEPFSEIEKFALELFASQAASIINDQQILAENQFRAKAHDDFTKAIETVASRDNIELLLQDVAQYAHTLVINNLKYSVSSNAKSESKARVTESEYLSSLPNLVSYVVMINAREEFEAKAAFPPYELSNFKYCDSTKKGITGLAAQRAEPIIIGNITEEREKNTEEGIEYIEFKPETLSQLAVPILYDGSTDDNNRVIGVINLEHSLPYAFDKLHQQVIEHFARQVAIAVQKKNLIDQISNNNKMLASLHQSLAQIVRESPQTMLYRAVSQTREALGAEAVIVIPYKKQKIGNPVILKDEIIPVVGENLLKVLDVLEEISLKVYREQKQRHVPDDDPIQFHRNFDQKKFKRLGYSYGLCLPFSSVSKTIGVMWILFSNPIELEMLKKNEYIYMIYANQIALAYDNSKQFEELKKKNNEDLTREIKIDYKDARRQAILFFFISVVTSIFGLGLIFNGVNQLLQSDSKNPPNNGVFAASAGVFLQAVTILAFARANEANKRLDRYHQELYNVGQLSILLSAAEQLDPIIVQEEKQKIIQRTTHQWLQPDSPVGKIEDSKIVQDSGQRDS